MSKSGEQIEDHLEGMLEDMVDKTDIGQVVTALAQVCYEKSAHLAENWQDARGGRYWNQLANALNRVAELV